MARFPAIDPEPPPLSPGRRAARAAAVAASVVAAVAAVTVVPDLVRDGSRAAATRATPSAEPPRGRVVVVDGLHLSIADSRGRVQRALTADLQIDPSFVDLVPDPAGRRGATGPGAGFAGMSNLLVDLATPGARAVPAAPADLLRGGALAEAPWADAGRALVLLTGPYLDDVGLVDVATGRLTRLGAGAEGTGDPTSRSAVVAAGGTPLPDLDGQPVGSTFTRIERLQPGRPPVVLQTAGELARTVGLPVGSPLLVQRMAYSPDGSRLAIAFDRAGTRVFPQGTTGPPSAKAAGAVVVLDRSGRVVGARPSRAGRGVQWIRWSSDGRLALGETVGTSTLNFFEYVLTYWDVRGPAVDVRLPGAFPNTLLKACAWSPTGARLLCGDDRGWFDVDVATATATPIASVTGRPLAWLP